jgi:hypothetical protein
MNVALKSLQLILGMLTGLVGIIGVLGGAGYYFFVTQMSTPPPKPVFAEERDRGKSAVKPKPKTSTKPAPAPAVKDPQKPDAVGKLPPEAFDAKVIWKDGLSLKKEPDSGAEKVGSVAFNGKVAIVKTSDDRQWVLIQSQMDNVQGWVKAGNIDKAAAAVNEVQVAPKSVKPQVKARTRRVRPQPETAN